MNNEVIEIITESKANDNLTLESIPLIPSLPLWLFKTIKRQERLNEKYDKAHEVLSDAWQDFLSEMDSINQCYRTTFDIETVLRDFENKEIVDCKDV